LVSEPRTDLAIEAREGYLGDIPGVEVTEQRYRHYSISCVTITNSEASAGLKKPQGKYITIDVPQLRSRERELESEISGAIARELGKMLPQGTDVEVLVVGLGNWNATPDALGPRVVEEILITRHLRDYVPRELKGRLRSVCAIAPGVLGLTGIETGEIIAGIVERIKPDAIIAVDSLAARTITRILSTIQITDTGIHPGSGVGSKRFGITQSTLGIPVIAIGVPTVVHANTIVNDAFDVLMKRLGDGDSMYAKLGHLDAEEKRRLINSLLSPTVGDLMVTPKEIDLYIDEMATIVAGGINAALHPDLDIHQALKYLN